MKAQFKLPEEAEKWMDRLANADIDFWLELLEWVPGVPDFGLSDKIEEEINKALEAAQALELGCDLVQESE